MIQSFLVVGGGSAGFLSALVLKKAFPDLPVTVVRSKEIGVIGVGESTTANIPATLHGHLELDPGEFYREVYPSWKLGIRFLWGPRPHFDYSFGRQLDWRWAELSRQNGYYCYDDFTYADVAASLMSHDKAFVRQENGLPLVEPVFGYHIENRRFVAYLEATAPRRGITVVDDQVVGATRDDCGVTGVRLASGRTLSADLYVDCSGFRSLLLGGALAEPYQSFKSTLFCDRAVVGSWERAEGEVIHPYTTAETMDAGWCWQIEHPDLVNRGYVYSSAFLSDDEAEREFRRKNPKVGDTRLIPFASGRYDRGWVKNVVAVGNAVGFVEPLESTALAVTCDAARILANVLRECERRPTPSAVRQYNRVMGRAWDTIRDFLGIHYKFNTRLDTPFWRAARADVTLGPVQELIDYYRENGPSTFFHLILLESNNMFLMEGYLTLLVGQAVPHRSGYTPPAEEQRFWEGVRARNRALAENGVGVREALDVVLSPDCRWRPGFFQVRSEAELTTYVTGNR